LALRVPQSFSTLSARQTGMDTLEAELAGEKAGNLGRMGRRVEAAMSALNASTLDRASPERAALVKAGAQAVWAYFVQREMCGVFNHRDAITLYGIPKEVLVRLGAAG
jgi:hypothetical protein